MPTAPSVTSTTTVAVTTVTSVTAQTTTAGGGTANATDTYLTNNVQYQLVAYNSAPSTATLTNITLKLNAVHMTTTSAQLTIAFYLATVPNQAPSGSYPLQMDDLGWGITITNSTPGFLHIPTNQLVTSTGLPFTVPGNFYYGIGFFVNATHSRGSGASGSGVAVADSTGGSGWTYGADSRAPVITALYWPGGTLTRPLYGMALLGYGVGVVTVSGTTTLTTVTSINTVGVTTSLVPVSGCLGCGASLGQSLEFAVMGFGLSQGVADWLLTFIAIIGFAAIGAVVMVGVGAADAAVPIAAIGGFGGLALAMGMGWLSWVYFALLILVMAALGVVQLVSTHENQLKGG
jgi:hypothetical protein